MNILLTGATGFSSQKGVIDIDENNIFTSFREKGVKDEVYVNSGYMICKKEILNYIDGDKSAFDTNVSPKLFNANQVNSYKNDGNWKLGEKENDVKELNKIWESGEMFWRK